MINLLLLGLAGVSGVSSAAGWDKDLVVGGDTAILQYPPMWIVGPAELYVASFANGRVPVVDPRVAMATGTWAFGAYSEKNLDDYPPSGDWQRVCWNIWTNKQYTIPFTVRADGCSVPASDFEYAYPQPGNSCAEGGGSKTATMIETCATEIQGCPCKNRLYSQETSSSSTRETSKQGDAGGEQTTTSATTAITKTTTAVPAAITTTPPSGVEEGDDWGYADDQTTATATTTTTMPTSTTARGGPPRSIGVGVGVDATETSKSLGGGSIAVISMVILAAIAVAVGGWLYYCKGGYSSSTRHIPRTGSGITAVQGVAYKNPACLKLTPSAMQVPASLQRVPVHLTPNVMYAPASSGRTTVELTPNVLYAPASAAGDSIIYAIPMDDTSTGVGTAGACRGYLANTVYASPAEPGTYGSVVYVHANEVGAGTGAGDAGAGAGAGGVSGAGGRNGSDHSGNCNNHYDAGVLQHRGGGGSGGGGSRSSGKGNRFEDSSA
eukprot:gene5377-13349_t